MIGAAFHRIERLRQEADRQQRSGQACEVKTNFPKHSHAPGLAYSKNFARCLQMGRFAVQERT